MSSPGDSSRVTAPRKLAIVSRTPEQEEAYRKYLAEAKCDVCGNQGIVGVAAMPGVPGSFAYCRACLGANAHPYAMVVANTAMIGGLADAAEWWKQLVDDTLTHLAIDRDKFDADVADGIMEMDDYFSHLALQEGLEPGQGPEW